MRKIVLDTETTGISIKEGHRIVEIGCVEIIDRKVTGEVFHAYINPQKEMDAEVIKIHGITNEFVKDKPYFKGVVEGLLAFVGRSEVIAHNATFDVNFLNHELALVNKSYGKLEDYCNIVDSLSIARKKHPGQKNNLDALCKRYFIDNSTRTYHGALLDAQLLAEVYLAMTGGQTSLFLDSSIKTIQEKTNTLLIQNLPKTKIIYASEQDLIRHDNKINHIN